MTFWMLERNKLNRSSIYQFYYLDQEFADNDVTEARLSLACSLLVTTWPRLYFHTYGETCSVTASFIGKEGSNFVPILWGQRRENINVLPGLLVSAVKISFE